MAKLDEAKKKIQPAKPQGYREPSYFLQHVGDPDLQQEQLVEREAPPPLLRLLAGRGPVQRPERVGTRRQPLARPQLGREGVPRLAGQRTCTAQRFRLRPEAASSPFTGPTVSLTRRILYIFTVYRL